MLPVEHQNPLGPSDIYLTLTGSFYCKRGRNSSCMISWFYFIIFIILTIPFLLQGWPVGDISPFEALMLHCSYEERTKETIDPHKLESGELKLSELLTKEHFDMVHLVNSFYLYHLACRFLTSATT